MSHHAVIINLQITEGSPSFSVLDGPLVQLAPLADVYNRAFERTSCSCSARGRAEPVPCPGLVCSSWPWE